MKILFTVLFMWLFTSSEPLLAHESSKHAGRFVNEAIPSSIGEAKLKLQTVAFSNTRDGDRNDSKSIKIMRKVHSKSYRLTKLKNLEDADTFWAKSQELGARDLVILGQRGRIKFYIETKGYAGTNSTSRINIDTISSEAVKSSNSLLPGSPRKAGGANKRQWHGYTVQYFIRNKVVNITTYTEEDKKRPLFGNRENLEISLDTKDLFLLLDTAADF